MAIRVKTQSIESHVGPKTAMREAFSDEEIGKAHV